MAHAIEIEKELSTDRIPNTKRLLCGQLMDARRSQYVADHIDFNMVGFKDQCRVNLKACGLDHKHWESLDQIGEDGAVCVMMLSTSSSCSVWMQPKSATQSAKPNYLRRFQRRQTTCATPVDECVCRVSAYTVTSENTAVDGLVVSTTLSIRCTRLNCTVCGGKQMYFLHSATV